MILARVWLLGMVVVLGVCPVGAQTDARGLERALKGKELYLRSYSSEAVDRSSWVDGKLVEAPAAVHTVGAFTASGVKLKGSKLEIGGFRASLSCEPKKGRCGLTGKNGMRLEIDLNNADPGAVIPQLQDLLFFADQDAAIDALPKKVEAFFKPPAQDRSSAVDPKVIVPRILRQTNPGFTQEARDNKVNGSVRIGFVVDTNGVPQDLWLLKSLGYGLDEAAEAALRTYAFAPAMKDGKPVAVGLAVDVNFATF